MARSLHLLCAIVERRYVFINLNLENDLSQEATVTGRVTNRTQAVVSSHTDEDNLLVSKRFSTSNTETLFYKSVRNSSTNIQTLWGNASPRSVGYMLTSACAASCNSFLGNVIKSFGKRKLKTEDTR